jgi:hypothetical protein
MEQDLGASSGPGSRPSGQVASRLDASRFDPSRGMTVAGKFLDARALAAGVRAMKPGLGIDYFEAWDVAKALLPACRRRNLNATYVADRLLQRARQAGFIRHRGKGQWVLCDSDGPRMAETNEDSARGEAGPARAEGIAQTPSGDHP